MRLARFSLGLLLIILSLASVSGAPRAAEVPLTCPNGQCIVYLPLKSHNTQPRLLAPADGATIGTFAPLLTWEPGMPGVHRIQLSQDPQFSPFSQMALDTTKSVRSSTTTPIQTLVTSNLNPNSIYYWRVGIPTPEGYSYPIVHSFVTPSADAVTLPPIVTLKSPGNNTKLRSRNVTLTWQAIPDVISYRVRVYYPNGDRYLSEDVPASSTSFDVTGLPGKTTFSWRVKAFGSTGWSPEYSQTWVFTTP